MSENLWWLRGSKNRMISPREMKAKLTEKHGLHVGQWFAPAPGVKVPREGQPPGTWISWLIDGDTGKLVPNIWSVLGFGEYQESYQRQAYDETSEHLGVTLSQPQQLFESANLPSGNPTPTYDVSADGQRFLTIAPAGDNEEEAPPKIRLVQNWYKEFRDREQD